MDRQLEILVVDDEQIVLDSIKKHLRKEKNYVVTGVLSVQEALILMHGKKYDIILTDLMMPKTDGLEFMQLAKADHPKLPVIMITGYATINTALKATQLGAFDYIAKPFSKTELLNVIRRAAELVVRSEAKAEGKESAESEAKPDFNKTNAFKLIGDQSWIMKQADDTVLMGIDRSFLHAVGRIQSVFLPNKGDILRQGSVYLQVFSSDLRSHTVITPLSGTVIEINDKVSSNPDLIIDDPYDTGWLIKLKPSNFDQEIKLLGL